MPAILTPDSQPRELRVHYLASGDVLQVLHARVVQPGMIDTALMGKAQILDHGVAFWDRDGTDGRTVIPWPRIIKIEEVF